MLLLYACTPKTTQKKLPVENIEPFSVEGTEAIPDLWWTSFNDVQLDSLVQTALDKNFNLKTFQYRVLESQALVKSQRSFLFPDLEAQIQSSFNRPQPDFVGGENVQLGLSSFYQLDLWGRLHALTDAERFRAEATVNDYRAATLSLSARVAGTWYQLLAARQRLLLVEQQIANNEQTLQFIKAQFGSGQIRSVDILRQEQLLKGSEQQKVNIESQIAVLEHQLSVLLGQPAQNGITYVADSFPEIPPLPEAGLPADLISRRPDIQRTFQQLQATDREVAAAISNRYPRISFNTSIQLRANSFESLLNDWAYSLGGNLVAPLFRAGQLKAEVSRTKAVKNAALYDYGQTVLIAFQEVEDALIQEQKQREQLTVLQEQLELAGQSVQQLRYEYFNGLTDYLGVLTALRQEQQLQQDVLNANLNLIQFRIALYSALAGGFETPALPQSES